MKKTLCIILTLSFMLSVFFYNYIYGATGNVVQRKTTSGNLNTNLTYQATATEFYPMVETSLNGGVTTYILVSAKFTNVGDTDYYIVSPHITLNFDTSAYIQTIDNLSTDLFLEDYGGGSANICASADFAYNSGFIVPAHQTIWLVSELGILAQYNTSQQATTSPDVTSITFGATSSISGTYNVPGSAKDLSAIETVLNNINNNTDNIEALLTDIKTQLRFNGSFTAPTNLSYQTNFKTSSQLGVSMPSNTDYWVMITRMSSFSVSELEVPVYGTSYNYIHDCFIVPFQVNIAFNNYSGHALRSSEAVFRLSQLFNQSSMPTFLIWGFNNDVFDYPQIQLGTSTFDLVLPYKFYYDNQPYIPNGRSTVNFTVLAVFDKVTDYNINSDYSMSVSYYASDVDFVTPNNAINEINRTLIKIYDAVSGNASTNSNITNDSNSLKSQSDSVHSQEASYYAQNTQAIQATGLSNYQFDNSTVSGLQGVRGDFVDVWNALGGWNSVYIFSLTLGLALTILRHSPSAISSAIKRKRYNNNE